MMERNRCITATLFVVIALLCNGVDCQFVFPASTGPCPADNNIIGYTSIASMNADMQTEIDRISGGGDFNMDQTYNMILCPMMTFDTSADALQPLLNGAQFTCGTSGSVNGGCVLSGGNRNVEIQSPSINNYVLSMISFMGITFEDFSSRSIQMDATSETTVTFTDSLWQNFDTTNIFRIRNNNAVVGNIVVRDSRISGANGGAQASVAFANEGGMVTIDGLTVESATINEIFETTNNGSVTVSNSQFTNSNIRTVATTNGGRTDMSFVEVSNNQDGITLFLVDGANSEAVFQNLDVTSNAGQNNALNNFQILSVINSGSATVLNSTFVGNMNVQHIMHAFSDPNNPSTPNIYFEDTDIIGNTASFEVLIFSEGNGANIELTRSQFIENTGGLANIGAFFGGDVSFTQTCFIRNNNFIVAVSLENSEYIAFNNYAEDEVSTICGGIEPSEGGGRMSVEIPGSMCFQPDSTRDCLVDCTKEANDRDRCLADENLDSLSPTVSSSPSISMSPSLSNAPTMASPVSPTDPPTISMSPSLSNRPTEGSPVSPTNPPTISTSPSSAPVPQTDFPTVSPRPSPGNTVPPTLSHQPTLSNQPTVSHEPSISFNPTISQQPSISSAPSISSRPSNLEPTVNPTARQTAAITDFPTLSMIPTISMVPSSSVLPSFIPTVTSPTKPPIVNRNPLKPNYRPYDPHEKKPGSGHSSKGHGIGRKKYGRRFKRKSKKGKGFYFKSIKKDSKSGGSIASKSANSKSKGSKSGHSKSTKSANSKSSKSDIGKGNNNYDHEADYDDEKVDYHHGIGMGKGYYYDTGKGNSKSSKSSKSSKGSNSKSSKSGSRSYGKGKGSTHDRSQSGSNDYHFAIGWQVQPRSTDIQIHSTAETKWHGKRFNDSDEHDS